MSDEEELIFIECGEDRWLNETSGRSQWNIIYATGRDTPKKNSHRKIRTRTRRKNHQLQRARL